VAVAVALILLALYAFNPFMRQAQSILQDSRIHLTKFCLDMSESSMIITSISSEFIVLLTLILFSVK